MRMWGFFQFFANLFEKIGDVIFAKKRAEEKRRKAIIITVVCVAVVLTVGGIIASIVIMKRKGIDVSPRGIVNKIKAKFNKEEELCLGFDECDCEDMDISFE